jgi:O-acetyl-ADP-ribose deacetylase (regulator of RNase III)
MHALISAASAATVISMIEPGAQVLEYEVWGHLGGGGMSDVWLARHVDLAMPVIIKTLKPDLRATPAERVQRMLTEARLMARIPSPFVVRAYDVSTYRDTPFMAQEYVDGLDLNELDHLRRDSLGHGLPLWFVCEMTAQIAHALHGAHQHGVLHRDVKPSNLFGSPEVGAKLGDFGIAVAKRLSERSHADQSGTLRFMSPEALRGESLDRRSDVYALGATAFDLRYGTPPFPNPMVLITGTPHPSFPVPTSAAEAQFQYVLARILAYSREHRYPNLAEPRRLLRALAKAAQRPPHPTRLGGGIHFCGARIITEAGDISRMSADGIVSSANWQLQMRTGVGEALRRAGGDVIEDEARAQGEQPLGACVVTGPGQLQCRHVLHAVSAWEQASCVGRATQRALLIAERLGLRTLVLPALGTGAAGVALEACASTMAAALRWHMELGGTRLSEVRIVLYDDEKLQSFKEVFEAGLLGEEEPVPDWGLPHVAARIDDESTSGDAPTVMGVLPLRRD